MKLPLRKLKLIFLDHQIWSLQQCFRIPFFSLLIFGFLFLVPWLFTIGLVVGLPLLMIAIEISTVGNIYRDFFFVVISGIGSIFSIIILIWLAHRYLTLALFMFGKKSWMIDLAANLKSKREALSSTC